ncbi:MAG TPA: PHP domain-containing protein, partial [Methyloversatilis sp.]
MSPSYAELHCLSHFSFLRGASAPAELMQRAAELGYAALAITDECSLAGVVRAHLALRALPEPRPALIVGSEIRLADGPKLVLLACDREGYGNLSELVTLGRMRADKGSYHLTRSDLDAGLPGCLALLVPDLTDPDGDGDPDECAHWLKSRFGDRAWLAAELHLGPDDAARLRALQAIG